MRIVSAQQFSTTDGSTRVAATDERGRVWTCDPDADSEVPEALRAFLAEGGVIMPGGE